MADERMSCPSLSISHFNGNVAMSTFNTSIGAIVRFVCPSDQDIMSGDSVLQCDHTGRWNGTVPQCINTESQNLTTTTTGNGYYQNISTSSNVISTTEVTSLSQELGIDTIVIVLWAVGGVMLITLVILLACILQSHKKARRERANLARARRATGHGGVNPSFSAYDEIWQWIPVVRNSRDQCQSRGSSSAEQHSSNRERNLLSTLQLPSYNEAVRQISQHRESDHSVPSHLQHSRVGNNVSGRQNNTGVSVIHLEAEGHYETIPFDRLQRSTTNPVSSISVSSPVTTTHSYNQSGHYISSRGIQRSSALHLIPSCDRRITNPTDETLQIRPTQQVERSVDYRDHAHGFPVTGQI